MGIYEIPKNAIFLELAGNNTECLAEVNVTRQSRLLGIGSATHIVADLSLYWFND